MKKNYIAPTAEKIEFRYQEQVVASQIIGTKYATQQGGDCEYTAQN